VSRAGRSRHRRRDAARAQPCLCRYAPASHRLRIALGTPARARAGRSTLMLEPRRATTPSWIAQRRQPSTCCPSGDARRERPRRSGLFPAADLAEAPCGRLAQRCRRCRACGTPRMNRAPQPVRADPALEAVAASPATLLLKWETPPVPRLGSRDRRRQSGRLVDQSAMRSRRSVTGTPGFHGGRKSWQARAKRLVRHHRVGGGPVPGHRRTTEAPPVVVVSVIGFLTTGPDVRSRMR